MRTAIASRFVENQIKKYSEEGNFCFGLLIGQPSLDSKDYIVYVAKTPNDSDDVGEIVSEDKTQIIANNLPVDSIENVDPQLLVNHAVSVNRMIPGSFFILGMFIVSEKNIFEDEAGLKKTRECVMEINKILSENKIFRSNSELFDYGQKVVLHCSSSGSNAITCKSLCTKNSSGSYAPADWKVLDKPVSWYMFETNYDLDEVFPIVENSQVLSIEDNFLLSLQAINDYLEYSIIFIQHEVVEDSLTLEAYLKSKREKKEIVDSFKTTLFFPATVSKADPSRIIKYHGTIRYSGIVYSRIYAQPKSTFKDIQHFIRNDILRSLSARVQIYCDGLTEPTITKGTFFVSEPPRRVFVKVPDCIEFSEYLFRGEPPEVVVHQVKQMLDLEIETDNIVELESLPVYDDDVSTLSSNDSTTNIEGKLTRQDIRKNMYLAGIVGAIVILLLSLLLHFVFR